MTDVGDAPAIVMIDAAGHVTHWDDTAEVLFGHASADMMGRAIDRIVPPEFRASHRGGIERVMGGGERHLEGAATHLPVLHADGRIVCHPARFHHLCTGDDRMIAAAAVFGPAAPDRAPWSAISDAGS